MYINKIVAIGNPKTRCTQNLIFASFLRNVIFDRLYIEENMTGNHYLTLMS